MRGPETQYVTVGDADVAYQVVDDGPFDLLYFYGLGSHVDNFWDIPEVAEFLKRLASFSRLLFFDRRGTGASDALPHDSFPTWEEWTEDVGAVLDAAGSKQVAILASLDSGPIAMLYAALHPERVSALILLNTAARYLVAEDYPIGASSDAIETLVSLLRASWGTDDLVRVINPSMADDPGYVHIVAKQLRAAATPHTAAAQYRYILQNLDVRQALPLIQAPTLVLHAGENPMIPIEHGRFLAEHIDAATFVELPGGDLGITSGSFMVVDEVAEFLTGERPTVEVERILTTVLFTDIVGSTETAASLGDQRWRAVLDDHDRAVREQLRRFRGIEINTTGDGFLASFDGPARAIRCAQAITEATAMRGIDLRVGLHTGECEVRGDDLAGLAVHIAARVGASAAPGDVLVSGTVRDLVVGSGIAFTERGEHKLKGVPGTWKLFAVES
jgi:class 3 adenylate cyclase/pimeloyl-ACP methyl ester carboxylesterase